MDNVAFHHSKIIKELIHKKGWEYLYTPPYSPVFNPIEGVFSIVKRHYSKCMDIVSSFNIVTNTHIKAFFKHSFNAISNIILV
jgi:transposase